MTPATVVNREPGGWRLVLVKVVAQDINRRRKNYSLEPFKEERMRPKLTVLIPCKDEERNLRACIESVLPVADEVAGFVLAN